MKKLIVINGPAGVGKSTVAELLNVQIKPSFLLSGDSIRRFLNDYHDYPREGRTIRNKVILGMLDNLLTEDLVVILEQLHTDSTMLDKYTSIARKHRVDTHEYFLSVSSEDELLRRFRQRQLDSTSHQKSSLTEERVRSYWHRMKTLADTRYTNSTIDTTGILLSEVVKQIVDSSGLK